MTTEDRNPPRSGSDVPSQYAHIKGWGIDTDPKNNPTYPMKQRVDIEHAGYNWERPAQQPVEMEVHHSIERPNITAVFGTSSAPRGLSGTIRLWAFKYSEDQYNHWLGLLLADRIDMVEGVLDDLAHGHLPNLIEERGLRADWQYDRERLLGKVAIGIGLAGAAWWLWRQRSHDDEEHEQLDYYGSLSPDDDEPGTLGREYYGDYDREGFYGTIRPL